MAETATQPTQPPSIEDIYNKALSVRYSLALLDELLPLYGVLKSLDKRSLYYTKKQGFLLGVHNLIEQALQLDFHLIKGGWKGARTLLDLTALFFVNCGQSSSVFVRTDLGNVLIELGMRAAHSSISAKALHVLCVICDDPLPDKNSFSLRVANNSYLKEFLKMKEQRIPGKAQARNASVVVAALQLIDVVARCGNSHAEVLSRIVDNENKRDSVPAIVAEILLETISSIGTEKSNFVLSCAISTLISLCIHCPTNILLLRALKVHKKLARAIADYPYLESEFLPFLEILRDDVAAPRALSKAQAATLIQKTWRGKRVRMQAKRVLNATRFLQKWILATLPLIAKTNALRRFYDNYYREKKQKKLQGAVDRANAEYVAVESVPSNALSLYLKKRKDTAASKIQALWRGYTARKTFARIREDVRRDAAARKIQRFYKQSRWYTKKHPLPQTPMATSVNFLGRHELLKRQIRARPPNSPMTAQTKLAALLREYPKERARHNLRLEHINALLKETNDHFQFLQSTKGSLDALENRFSRKSDMHSPSSLYIPPGPPPQSAREQVAHTLHQKDLALANQPWWKTLPKPNWDALN